MLIVLLDLYQRLCAALRARKCIKNIILSDAEAEDPSLTNDQLLNQRYAEMVL